MASPLATSISVLTRAAVLIPVCRSPATIAHRFSTTAYSRGIVDELARAVVGHASTSVPDVIEAVGGAANIARLKRVARDFRSDTITIPTDAQLLYALRASRGDDVYLEDAATTELESRLAQLTGKEAALFCASGTMSNQLAIRSTLTQPPHSIIADHRSHIHLWEAGGAALFSQATTHALTPSNGSFLTVADVETNLHLGDDVHSAPTRLIALENTMGGVVHPQHEVEAIGALARAHGIPLHLDGARIWNVAAREVSQRGLDARSEPDVRAVLTTLLAPFDSASLCLSKGLGAPVGSVLVGSAALVKRARWFRKAFGGGWRQSGVLAAQADWAVTHHFPRLEGTHRLATRLAEGLQSAGCTLLAPVDTNMVYFDASPVGLTTAQIEAALAGLDEPVVISGNRCVVHHQTSAQAVDDFVQEVKRLAAEVPREQRGNVDKATKGY